VAGGHEVAGLPVGSVTDLVASLAMLEANFRVPVPLLFEACVRLCPAW
jgi:hypothetical protein